MTINPLTSSKPKLMMAKKAPEEEAQSRDSSGLTIGLLIKMYTEFDGMTKFLFNFVYLGLIIRCIFEQNYNYVESGVLKNTILNTLQVDSANSDSIYAKTSTPDIAVFMCAQMQQIFTDSTQNNLSPESNNVNLGAFAKFNALAFTFSMPNYVFNSCDSAQCLSIRNITASKNNALLQPITLITNPKYYSNFVDQSYSSNYGSVVFDTRAPNWNVTNSQNALNYLCNVVLPAITPYVQGVQGRDYIDQASQDLNYLCFFQDEYEPLNQIVIDLSSGQYPDTNQQIGPLGLDKLIRLVSIIRLVPIPFLLIPILTKMRHFEFY